MEVIVIAQKSSLGGFQGRWIWFSCQNYEIQDGGSNIADEKYENWSDSLDICYSRVFGVAENESNIRIAKFEIADPICRTENMETDLICLKFVIRGFSGSLKMDRRQNFKIQNGGSNMVNWKCEWSKYDSVVRIARFEMANLMWWPENVKIYLIFLVLVSRGFLETLITNLNSE